MSGKDSRRALLAAAREIAARTGRSGFSRLDKRGLRDWIAAGQNGNRAAEKRARVGSAPAAGPSLASTPAIAAHVARFLSRENATRLARTGHPRVVEGVRAEFEWRQRALERLGVQRSEAAYVAEHLPPLVDAIILGDAQRVRESLSIDLPLLPAAEAKRLLAALLGPAYVAPADLRQRFDALTLVAAAVALRPKTAKTLARYKRYRSLWATLSRQYLHGAAEEAGVRRPDTADGSALHLAFDVVEELRRIVPAPWLVSRVRRLLDELGEKSRAMRAAFWAAVVDSSLNPFADSTRPWKHPLVRYIMRTELVPAARKYPGVLVPMAIRAKRGNKAEAIANILDAARAAGGCQLALRVAHAAKLPPEYAAAEIRGGARASFVTARRRRTMAHELAARFPEFAYGNLRANNASHAVVRKFVRDAMEHAPNARDAAGLTALHVAASADAARLLIKHGHDARLLDPQGRTFLPRLRRKEKAANEQDWRNASPYLSASADESASPARRSARSRSRSRSRSR